MATAPSVQALKLNFTIPIAPGVTLERFVYCYLIFGETITLIDSGVAGCGTEIFEAIRAAGRDPREIGEIILTHAHPDHMGGVWAIQRATGCRIAAHPANRTWIEDLDLQNRERQVPGFESLISGPISVDRELEDGDRITPDTSGDGMTELTVIHTPGHSPGSISLFMEDTGILFSGDSIPVQGGFPIYDDPKASVASIKRLRELEGVNILFSSWDLPAEGSDAYLKMDIGLAVIQRVHATVLASVAEGATDPAAITDRTISTLSLQGQAPGPLIARTIAGHMELKEIQNLLD
jgi:glyoxylase-like metal-dependent hydrolase (beta-lactamase superfamily II)